MLRYTFNQDQAADRIEGAVKKVLAQGLAHRATSGREGTAKCRHREMGDAVVGGALGFFANPYPNDS